MKAWHIDPRSSLPLHAQIEALIRRLLRDEQFRSGGLLPDEVTIAARLGVSRNTVRAGIQHLVQDGTLIRRRGVGTRLAPAASDRHQPPADRDEELDGDAPSLRLLRVSSRMARPDLVAAKALGLVATQEVLEALRVRGDDDGPVLAMRSWLHPRLGLGRNDDMGRSWATVLTADSATPTSIEHDLSADLADAVTAPLLDLRRGEALLLRRRTVRDARQQPLEHALIWYRPDRWQLRRMVRLGDGLRA